MTEYITVDDTAIRSRWSDIVRNLPPAQFRKHFFYRRVAALQWTQANYRSCSTRPMAPRLSWSHSGISSGNGARQVELNAMARIHIIAGWLIFEQLQPLSRLYPSVCMVEFINRFIFISTATSLLTLFGSRSMGNMEGGFQS